MEKKDNVFTKCIILAKKKKKKIRKGFVIEELGEVDSRRA